MIYYVKSKRTLMFQGQKQSRFVAKIFRSADTSLDTIAKEVSHATSLSYPDVLAALKAFEIHVSSHVLNGSAVKFGTLGAFIPAIVSKSAATAKEVDDTCIKRIRCRFYPSTTFRASMKSTGVAFKDLNKTLHV